MDFTFRSRSLGHDDHGRAKWRVDESTVEVDPTKSALLLCDVWDSHWCRGARERLDAMIPAMDALVAACRLRGMAIIHAPSDTMDFYADSPARNRIASLSPIPPPDPLDHDDPPLPIDASDHGSDTGETETSRAWTRQHPGITIDETVDVISASGDEIFTFLRTDGRSRLFIIGVHTNMCVLHRSFAIKAMVRRGVDVALVRDMTDAMYNPAMPPYVSHEAGTQLVVEFIEKFWCPSVLSRDFV